MPHRPCECCFHAPAKGPPPSLTPRLPITLINLSFARETPPHVPCPPICLPRFACPPAQLPLPTSPTKIQNLPRPSAVAQEHGLAVAKRPGLLEHPPSCHRAHFLSLRTFPCGIRRHPAPPSVPSHAGGRPGSLHLHPPPNPPIALAFLYPNTVLNPPLHAAGHTTNHCRRALQPPFHASKCSQQESASRGQRVTKAARAGVAVSDSSARTVLLWVALRVALAASGSTARM